MTVDTLLSRLQGVRALGKGQWMARCPAHEDRSPSLSVGLRDNGCILLHCFAGCATSDVLAAVGLTLADLFPEPLHNPTHPAGTFRRERCPFDPLDTLRIVARAALVCALTASDAAAGKPISEADAQQAAFAVGRIMAALDAVECRP